MNQRILTMAKKKHQYLAVLMVTATLGAVTSNLPASADSGWSIDPAHTSINFSIKHFFTPVKGNFNDFEIDLDYDAEKPENSSVEARIKVASVHTRNKRRDNDLRTGNWFEVESHPDMTFKSTSVRRLSDNELVASGPLTIKGVSHDVELAITVLGIRDIPAEMQQRMGGTKQVAGFKASTSIDRGDFGVGVGNFAATLVVGGRVDIEILLEAHNK
jgi:polyisoprenoid-binding protein YceI